MLDLIALVPDADWEHTVRTLLSLRTAAIGMRPIAFDVIRHPQRDPGVRVNARSMLRTYVEDARFALAMVDLDGSGHTGTVAQLESSIIDSLAPDWVGRCGAIAVEPELEVWIWSTSPHVPHALGWDRPNTVRSYLEQAGFWQPTQSKPSAPKDALMRVLRETRKPRSPEIFKEVAAKVSVANCVDPSFVRFRELLRSRFPLA